MKNYLLVLLLLPATMVWSQSEAEKNVGEAEERWNNALVANDSNTLKNLTVAALSFGHSSGKVEDKQTFINNAVYGTFKFQSIAATDQTILLAKRTAIVRYVLVAKATNNGAPADVKLGVLQVWQKKRGDWKLLARQAVKLWYT